MRLDKTRRVRLEPDLSWWQDRCCVFVGDAKYKNVAGERSVPNADLYQLLAYVTALDLPGGLLIYAQGEADTTTYRVRHSRKRLEVAALDLSGTMERRPHPCQPTGKTGQSPPRLCVFALNPQSCKSHKSGKSCF